jgi:hypothetical protein
LAQNEGLKILIKKENEIEKLKKSIKLFINTIKQDIKK